VQDVIEISADTSNEALRRKIAEKLRESLVANDPPVNVELKRDDPATQDAGVLIEIALGTVAHLAAMGIAESLRFAWERYKIPIVIRFPNGSQSIVDKTFDSDDLVQRIQGLSSHDG
jgi:hypothetical protein